MKNINDYCIVPINYNNYNLAKSENLKVTYHTFKKNLSYGVHDVLICTGKQSVYIYSRCHTCLKEIGKEIYFFIIESIQGVVMNAHKTPPSRLCCV